MKTLRRLGIAIATLSLLNLMAGPTVAAGPMPYNNEALARLNAAMAKIKVPEDIPGTGEQKVKTTIGIYRKIFAAAGYDYEQTMIRIITDIKENRYVVNRATVTLNKLARQLLEIHADNGVNPRKYLSRECAELIINFREIIRENMKKTGSC